MALSDSYRAITQPWKLSKCDQNVSITLCYHLVPLSPCAPITLCPYHLVPLSPCAPVTFCPYHLVLSPCAPITLCPYHLVSITLCLSPCAQASIWMSVGVCACVCMRGRGKGGTLGRGQEMAPQKVCLLDAQLPAMPSACCCAGAGEGAGAAPSQAGPVCPQGGQGPAAQPALPGVCGHKIHMRRDRRPCASNAQRLHTLCEQCAGIADLARAMRRDCRPCMRNVHALMFVGALFMLVSP